MCDSDVVSARLTLHPIAPAEARGIVDGSGRVRGNWHPEYPLIDELDPVGALAQSADAPSFFTLHQIRMRASGLAIGGIGFFGPPDADGRVEVGYGLVESARGQGFATEALRSLVEAAASRGAQSVTAETSSDNTASRTVLAKAGFTEIGQTEALVHYRLEVSNRPG